MFRKTIDAQILDMCRYAGNSFGKDNIVHFSDKKIYESSDNRKAGFYNVKTNEDRQIPFGKTHESENIYTYNDFDNGWVRYGIFEGNKRILYMSTTNKNYAQRLINFISRKYPTEIIDLYEVEIISEDKEPLILYFDSEKNIIDIYEDYWLFSMKNVHLLYEYEILENDKLQNFLFDN